MEPEDLWFREAFIDRLWEILATQHLVLSAPRRMGKTSVLDALADSPREGFEPIPVYVQDINHPADFLFLALDLFHERHPKLFRDLFKGTIGWIGKALNKVDEVSASGFKVKLRQNDPDWRSHWKTYGDEFFCEVRQHPNRLLLLVDEFPDMILNMQKDHPELVRIWKRHGKRLTARDVQSAFADLVISSGARDKLGHFHSRIDRYYKTPKREAAYSILAKLSLSKDGLRRAKLFTDFERILLERGSPLVAEGRKRLFNHLMRDLENDFYVAEIQPGVFDFASGLLKKWWKKYYA